VTIAESPTSSIAVQPATVTIRSGSHSAPVRSKKRHVDAKSASAFDRVRIDRTFSR